MQQVFYNLLENALAACPHPAEMIARWTELDHNGRPALQLSLRDNGPGITPENRERVFEAFFTTKPKGTGLGLAIARRFVEAHDGVIRVGIGDAQSIQGAKLVITLPRTPVLVSTANSHVPSLRFPATRSRF